MQGGASVQTVLTAESSATPATTMEDDVKSAIDTTTTTGHGSIETKGGFRASIFIYGLMSLDNMGFVANMVSLAMYFNLLLHFDVSGSANTLTNFMGSTFLLSILGGFISDTYIDRFRACLIFGTLEIIGLMLLIIQARYKSLQADDCGKSSCIHGSSAAMLYITLSLYALGNGGVRASLPTLGADQFDKKNPKEAKALARYFNWLLLVVTWGGVLGVTVIVWVSTNKGWWKGFLISLIGSLVGFAVLAIGKPFYRIQAPGESPILRIIQVIVVAIKNRKLSLPKSADELHEHDEKELVSEKIPHTEQFRWLDKAAILPEGSGHTGAWKVCTVTQVEEIKILTRMLPIIASTIIMNTCLAQLQTYSVEQSYMMNRNLGSNFQVPAPSVPVIPLVFMSILIPVYEYLFVPFARKFTNHPSGITQLQRVGVGLVLSIISMAAAALVEVKRRNQSISSHMLKPIHVFWLAFQYGIFGIADMFTLVGLLEFFYREAPEGMKSLSTSFTWLSLSFGYFLSSVLVDVINSITKRTRHDKQAWLEGLYLDNYKLDLFYWFLAILSCLNFFNYLYWASWYKYKKVSDDDDDDQIKSESSNINTTTNDQTIGGRDNDGTVTVKPDVDFAGASTATVDEETSKSTGTSNVINTGESTTDINEKN